MKDYNLIRIKSNLITNFKPTLIKNLKNLKLNSTDEKKFNNYGNILENQIYCKNFFIYLLLLKYRSDLFFSGSSIFIKKFKKKIYTILRSPYRHKLARHQISLNRYEINSSIKIPVKDFIKAKNWLKLIFIFNFLKSFNNIFESNILYTNSLRITIPLSYENNFKLISLNKNK